MADGNVTNRESELDQLFEQVMTCESAIPPSELEPLADLIRNQERVGRQWRLTALLASKNGEFFREVANDEEQARVLAATIGPLEDFSKLLRAMADLADCASSRLMVAGCNHEDFNDWVKEAA
jgi:hypothetical protein